MITYKYEVFKISKKWLDAESHCKGKKGHLASFSSKEQQTAAISEVDPSIYWIGLSDYEDEDQWKWSDGSSTSWMNWDGGEPNGGRGENCAQLREGIWRDASCNDGRYFVCKIPGM